MKSKLSIALAVVSLVASTAVRAQAQSWVPPIGVPAPSFGVNETVPAFPSSWTAAVSGFYYVCPTCSGATDSSNPNGYPAKPRSSMPSAAAGSVIVVNGQFSSDVIISTNASAASPVIVTSFDQAAPAKFFGEVSATGSYVIFDHIWIGPQSASDADFGFFVIEGTHHISLRNSELTGNANRSGGVGIGTWSYGGSASTSNIVIDHNNIHNIGDVAASSDQDAHCVTLNGSDDNIWVTYNTLAFCSGDAMQVEAQSGRRAKIHHVYYGKNLAHHNRQSGGWVKNATDVIFSQNVAHDFRENSGGPGACYGFQYDAEQVWFIYNEAYACNIGIAISGAENNPGQFAYIIGNIIHDTASQSPTDVYNAGAMVLRGGTNIWVVNNTFVNTDGAINMPPGSSAVFVYNNIFGGRSNSSTYDLYTEGSTPTVDVKNNLFLSTARFTNGLSAGTAAVIADPALVNKTGGNYHLTATSPAIDKGMVSTVYTTFSGRYGVDISRDYDGNHRPAGSAWDIGAYEFGSSGGSSTAPATPTNLRIVP